MTRKRSWTKEDLCQAVKDSRSVRQVLQKLGLIPAGGNYAQVTHAIREWKISTTHFTGMGWRKNSKSAFVAKIALVEILTTNSNFQSYKLKKRLFMDKLKMPQCELCGWNKKSVDGRIPVELDHINGDRFDNRLENLRILCPNCHSLQETHRGKNKQRRGGGTGRRPTLKMS